MRRKKAAFRKKKQNKFAFLLVILAVCTIAGTVSYKSAELKRTKDAYDAREAALDSAIADENLRADEINRYDEYTKTTKFIEEIARERLGLVYRGELIFKHD